MTELEKQLLAVLRECDEAMAYMSEYDIPLTLPDRVKEAIAAAEAAKPVAFTALTVWYGSMPESNGKANWTAILRRKGGCISEGFTLERSEYPGRVKYEADRVRYLIGELETEPSILDYDGDLHSGYVAKEPASALPAPPAPGNVRGAMFVEFVSALAAKAGHKELAADLLAAIRAAGETGFQGLPTLTEPACHIAEVSDEEVAIACSPAQRQLLREGMQLYAAPVAGGAIKVRKLGIFGKAYDGPQEKRAYTYTDQPLNVEAWRLGRAAVHVSAGGDLIDRGLSLLSTLQAEGFGVFEMADDSLAAGPQEGGEA